MNILTSRILVGVMCAAVLLPAALSQTAYPNQSIELIVGHAPGGGTDLLARDFALAAARHLPQPGTCRSP